MNKYFLLSIIGSIFFLGSCSEERDVDDGIKTAGTDAINLSGIITKSGVVNHTSLYFKAFRSSGAPNLYLDERPITITGGLMEDQANDIVFNGTTPYYPLLGEEIVLYAYTGKLNSNNEMILKAGHGDNYDAVLSNYGKTSVDAGVNKTYEPSGTPGTSANPAELLQFRHVMTQVTLDIKVDEEEEIPVNPIPKIVELRADSIVAQGNYSIRSSEPVDGQEPDLILDGSASGTYDLKLGVNYLVPTGAELVGKQLTHLVIDDYTALPGDLANFRIQPSGEEYKSMRLIPGYSYNLTITIKRLEIQSIKLERVPWQVQEVGSVPSYEPYTLKLDMGGNYINTGDDAITKVILQSDENKIYLGEVDDNSTDLLFTVLPQAEKVDRVELYTSKGLLLSTDVTIGSYDGNVLSLPLSKGGMLALNPTAANSADNPYLIHTPVQFINVSKEQNAFYRQEEIIDLNTLNLVNADRIFNGFTGDFSGVYDGNGHGIDGLDIEGPGLFEINSGTLKNVRILSGTMDASGQSVAGAIAGTNRGVIVACINEARIADAPGTVGGICGVNDTNGKVVACLNTGTILQGDIAGGIVGMNRNTAAKSISTSINTGMLNPNASILGVIVGNSLPSENVVVQSSFGLVGSAQHTLGGSEPIVGSGTVDTSDSSVLYPEILRNGLLPGASEDQRILNRLNTELSKTEWGGIYEYILDREKTGTTWPVPMMVE